MSKELTLLKLFDEQNIFFLEEFITCNGCFGLFTKIKKGVSYKIFVHSFCMVFPQNVPSLTFYQLKTLQCHTFFPSQDIEQIVLLSSYLDN